MFLFYFETGLHADLCVTLIYESTHLSESVGAVVSQDMFDTIDFSDNEIKKLENFPRMVRLTTLLLNNNHISKIAANVHEQVKACVLPGD